MLSQSRLQLTDHGFQCQHPVGVPNGDQVVRVARFDRAFVVTLGREPPRPATAAGLLGGALFVDFAGVCHGLLFALRLFFVRIARAAASAASSDTPAATCWRLSFRAGKFLGFMSIAPLPRNLRESVEVAVCVRGPFRRPSATHESKDAK